jgi:hypothetical protein
LQALSTLAVSDQLGLTTGIGRPLEIYWLELSSATFYRREIMLGVFHGAAIEHRHRGRGRFFVSEWSFSRAIDYRPVALEFAIDRSMRQPPSE